MEESIRTPATGTDRLKEWWLGHSRWLLGEGKEDAASQRTRDGLRAHVCDFSNGPRVRFVSGPLYRANN